MEISETISEISNLTDTLNYCRGLKDKLEKERQELLEMATNEYDCGVAFMEGEVGFETLGDMRDYDCLRDKLLCIDVLINALEEVEQGDKESLHWARKDLDGAIRTARRAHRQLEEDIRKAQRNCQSLTEIILICKKVRI